MVNKHICYRHQFQDRLKPHHVITRRTVQRRHYRSRIKSQTLDRCIVSVKLSIYRSAAPDDDKD